MSTLFKGCIDLKKVFLYITCMEVERKVVAKYEWHLQ